MKKLRCVMMRGGTSKGIFFHENELPRDIESRTAAILRVMGSPDKRQIDGLGGADILTSKAIIIGPPSRPDAVRPANKRPGPSRAREFPALSPKALPGFSSATPSTSPFLCWNVPMRLRAVRQAMCWRLILFRDGSRT
jgi:hypothetical protein